MAKSKKKYLEEFTVQELQDALKERVELEEKFTPGTEVYFRKRFVKSTYRHDRGYITELPEWTSGKIVDVGTVAHPGKRWLPVNIESETLGNIIVPIGEVRMSSTFKPPRPELKKGQLVWVKMILEESSREADGTIRYRPVWRRWGTPAKPAPHGIVVEKTSVKIYNRETPVYELIVDGSRVFAERRSITINEPVMNKRIKALEKKSA